MKVMMAKWNSTLQRREADAPCRPAGFTLIELLVVIALIALRMPTPAGAAESDEPSSLEETLAAIRACMAKSPAPWLQPWQDEYVETIRQTAVAHRDSLGYAARLEVLRNGFAPYWEGLRKDTERSLFEVHRAQIRWYVECLMAAELLAENDRQKLAEQYKDLLDHAAGALVTQFAFLDPNQVQAAKADHLAQCCRGIEAPLLPVFLHPLTEDQVRQLKERWHNLRYARVDLWRHLGGGAGIATKTAQVPSGNAHPDYLLGWRSLDQLRGQIWSLVPAPPDYYREAFAKHAAAQKQRVQSQIQARAQETQLGVAVWQAEYLSFLLAALLETAEALSEEE